MSSEALSLAIEAASLRAWPAIEEVPFEGWTLRFSEGFTGRANSVQALEGSPLPLADRLRRCEAWYEARGLPCLFRLTPFSEAGLDDHLAERGYARIKDTHVLCKEVEGLSRGAEAVELQSTEMHGWLRSFAQLNGTPASPAPLRRILERIGPESLLATLRKTEPARLVGCGLAVLDGSLLGLFDLVVASSERGKGYGRKLVRSLAAWGAERGATHTYLQVTWENEPALGLYRKLGFQPVYDYWYRIAPDRGGPSR